MEVEQFPIKGWIITDQGKKIPVRDVPMMDDETWQRMTLRDRLQNPAKYEALGEDVPARIAQLRAWFDERGLSYD